MGFYESRLAAVLITFLQVFLDRHDLGIVLGEAGTLRILRDQIRVPDVAFLSWKHFPDRVLPAEAVPSIAPDLAVEILSKSNTPREMERKLDDQFRRRRPTRLVHRARNTVRQSISQVVR